MNIAVLGLQALRVAELGPHTEKIHTSRKLIVDFEKQPDEASHLACRALRRVLKLVTNDPSASKEEQTEAKRLLYRIRSFDPRRAAKQGEVKDDTDLIAACSRPEDTDKEDEAGTTSHSDDVWDAPPPLPVEETLRIAYVQQPFSALVCGEFVLKPGSDCKQMIEAALDGRLFTEANLLKLHSHMERSFSAGGAALASGPLFSEITRILRSQGALPPIDLMKKSYGDRLMEELNLRI